MSGRVLPLSLSARDRRTLMLGGVTIVTLLMISRGIPAWIRWERHLRDDATTATAEALASQRAVRTAPQISRLSQTLEQEYQGLAPAFLEGEHTAAAGATLISRVNAAAEGAGVRLGALAVEADSSAEHGITVVRVHGDGASDVAGVARFLATLEGGAPILSIRDLSLEAADPHVPNEQPETIRINFVIEGLANYDADTEHGSDSSSREQRASTQ